MTQEILSKFPDSIIINIRHYKDVFNRPGQDSYIQNMSKSLILAVNTGNKIFEASPVCQNFGFGKFYYCESAMNCVFSCDYCFLKGMYKTSNVVVFVNYEDYLEECKSYLKTGPMYLCASFDTDLSAISNLCNWQKIWEDFAATNENLTIELRTKAALKNFRSLKNIIYAFTISPQDIIDLYEKKTPSLKNRLESVSVAINLGAQVRLCFDPMIYIKNYNRIYSEMMDIVESSIDLSKVRDFGVGTFRISADYLNNLRKSSPQSSAVLYPFCKENGYCVYPESTRSELTSVIVNRLERAGVGSKVFINE
ncbi:MAG: radical SAM protein [Saccharofermentans sp.]|nr:radical SAM protein [Saccharofermentans sp.]